MKEEEKEEGGGNTIVEGRKEGKKATPHMFAVVAV